MRLCVIDRYPSTGQAVAEVLQRERPGIRWCGQAYSPKEAVLLLQKQQPDVVLLEPLIYGAQPAAMEINLRHLRSLFPNTQLIILSSSDVREHIHAALRAGAREYLYRPINWKTLLPFLDELEQPDPGAAQAGSRPGELPNAFSSEELVHLIHQGKPDEAKALLEGGFAAWENRSYSEQCIFYMDIATQIVHLPESMDHVPEDLITLYQDFIKCASRHDDPTLLQEAMRSFVEQCAAIFNQFAWDAGYHQIQAVLRFIDEHLGEDLSLKRISNELFISPTYLSRLFRSKTGQKFSEYLAHRRVNQAKLLLVSSDKSITEIAREVGYPDANSFARLFKNSIGMTPSQYRKQSSKF